MSRFWGRCAVVLLAAAVWMIPHRAQAQLILMDGFAPFSGFGPNANLRYNMSVAPQLSMTNGQTSLMMIQGFGFYPSNSMVVQAGGAMAFVPQQQPVPFGLNLPVQAAFGPNGGRLNLAPTFQTPGIGPPFPVTSFIRPVYAGGAVGGPVPFTRILYPPSFSQVGIQTSVGASPFLGGWQGGLLGRGGGGAPVLGRVPTINRPFMNVGFAGGQNAFPVPAPRINIP